MVPAEAEPFRPHRRQDMEAGGFEGDLEGQGNSSVGFGILCHLSFFLFGVIISGCGDVL